MEKDELVADLNTLIAICRDGERGYRTVAKVIEPTQYHTLFTEYSEQRHRFATELQAAVNQLGGIPGKSGDLAGSIHRGWINLKAAVGGRDPGAILAECEAGEKAAVHVYQEIMQKDLPVQIHTIVAEQYQAIKAARARIQALAKQMP